MLATNEIWQPDEQFGWAGMASKAGLDPVCS